MAKLKWEVKEKGFHCAYINGWFSRLEFYTGQYKNTKRFVLFNKYGNNLGVFKKLSSAKKVAQLIHNG